MPLSELEKCRKRKDVGAQGNNFEEEGEDREAKKIKKGKN